MFLTVGTMDKRKCYVRTLRNFPSVSRFTDDRRAVSSLLKVDGYEVKPAATRARLGYSRVVSTLVFLPRLREGLG